MPVRARDAEHTTPQALNKLPVQKPQCGKRAPGARQFGPLDRSDMVAGRWLPRGPQEILVGSHLLFAPRLVSQRRNMIGEYLGDPRGAAHGGNDRPKRVVARSVQADRFNHGGKLNRLRCKIKHQSTTKPAE